MPGLGYRWLMRSLVLVTGAGASRELGVDGQMPLMTDWSESLMRDLNVVEVDLATAIGLRADMRGDEFEEVLGAFLEWQQTVDLAARFSTFGGPKPGTNYADVLGWLDNTRSRGGRVMQALHTNLYDHFGAKNVNIHGAMDAYGRLLQFIGRTDQPLTCATTNYDTSLELTFDAFGFRVHDGFPSASPFQTPILEPDGMVRDARRPPDGVAVLHLHGAVGWYRSETGTIQRYPSDQRFNQTLGAPALLLPDPKKDPSLHAGVSDIWKELAGALETASHVLVLGHSLNDGHLVTELKLHTRNAKVAVTTYPTTDQKARAVEEKRLRRLLPNAEVFPFALSPTITEQEVPDAMRVWGTTDPPE